MLCARRVLSINRGLLSRLHLRCIATDPVDALEEQIFRNMARVTEVKEGPEGEERRLFERQATSMKGRVCEIKGGVATLSGIDNVRNVHCTFALCVCVRYGDCSQL